MEEKKEFLTETNYEKGKQKIKSIIFIIIILGVLLGGSLILVGVIKTNQLKKQNESIISQVEQQNQSRSSEEVQTDISKTKEQIAKIDSEINQIEQDIKALRIEQDKIFRDDEDFSDRYYEKETEINNKENEKETKQKEKSNLSKTLSDYDSELWEIDSGYNNAKTEIEKTKQSIFTAKYIPLIVFGGFIIISSLGVAFALYIFMKRREITAFTAQQVMPVAQEGIEKMAPTIGNAAGTIAKGIKEGLNAADAENSDAKVDTDDSQEPETQAEDVDTSESKEGN